MATEHRTRPIERKEDVAGALDLASSSRLGSMYRSAWRRAQRVIQESQRVEHPRLVRAVLDPREARQRTVPHGASAESAGITNAKRALRSGFSMRVQLVGRIASARHVAHAPAPAPSAM